MTSFEQELLDSHGFSLILLDGLSVVISTNPQLLLPTKSVVVYAKKQIRSTIFEWIEEEKRWFWYVDDYLMGWEKRVKVTNISMPVKKSFAMAKSIKKGDDSSETCSDIVPFKGDFPPVGNIVLESSPSSSAHTHSNKCPTIRKSKPTALRLFANAPSSSRTQGSKRKTSPPPTSTTTKRRVCYL